MRDFEQLFVVGLGRSGTTALTRVLAAHPNIALGMERYQRLYNPESVDTVTPDLFDRARFFDFTDNYSTTRPDDSRWTAFYEQAAEHYKQARFVGDKTTETAVLPQLVANFPHARFVIIVRDAKPLAWSWEQRATNPDDKGWSASKDAVASIRFWNNSLRTVLDVHSDNSDRVSVVEYDSFFRDDAPVRTVIAQLGLDFTDELAAEFKSASSNYLLKIQDKNRDLPELIERKISQERDSRLWEDLRSIAV